MTFLRSCSWRSKDDSHFNQPSRLQTSKLFANNDPQPYSAPPVDHNRSASYDTPPPYNDRTYTQQLVGRLIDATTATLSPSTSSSTTTTVVDKKGIVHGIRLVEIAVDEYECGNEAIALDIYLSGLDKIIMALPNLKDHKTKEALREKLTSLESRVGIQQLQQQYQKLCQNNNEGVDDQMKTTNDRMSSNNNNTNSTTTMVDNLVEKFSILSNLLAPTWLLSIINRTSEEETDKTQQQEEINCCGDSLLKFKRLGRTTTDIIVQCVVLFKQSPIPGLLYLVFSYFVHLLLWLDQNFQVVEKIQNVGVTCIKKFLQADEKYHLHEFASEALYTFISASLRAIVAYKEAPVYLMQEERRRGERMNNHNIGVNRKNASFTSWIWSL